MARACVLYASEDRMRAWLRHGRRLGIDAEFRANNEGGAAFSDWLARHAHFDFTILADFADEEFELQEIPPVRGRDRRALVARRLGQTHFASALRTAIACGHRADGRRDERVLFAALPQPPALSRWLQVLEDADAAVAGIVSLAQLIERLPSLRAQAVPHRMVATATSAGLRQTLIEDGRLRLSRLTPAVPEAELPATCMAEAARLQQYLAGRTLADDAALPVTILAEARQAERYRLECTDSERLRFDYIDVDDESRRIGMRAELPLSVRTEAMFAHLLMRRPPAAQFAPASLRQDFVLRRAERILGRAAVFSCAAGLLVGGLQWVDARQLHGANEALAARTAVDAHGYETRLRALSPLPASAARLRTVLDGYEHVQRRSPQPTAAYRLLGHALSEFPQVVVERLDWKLGANDGAELELQGSLPPALADDRRAQLAIVDGLKRRLETAPPIDVRILRAPFDADPGKPLASKAVAASPRPIFSLRIVLPAS